MFQLTEPSVKLHVYVCAQVFYLCPLLFEVSDQQNCISRPYWRQSQKLACFPVVHEYTFLSKSGMNYQVITVICKFALSWREREGGRWDWLGWEWIRMATQVAQLLLKGLFITVRSLLAPSPLLSPSSILTRPHLNNGPNTKKHVVCVCGWRGSGFMYL